VCVCIEAKLLLLSLRPYSPDLSFGVDHPGPRHPLNSILVNGDQVIWLWGGDFST